MLKFNLWKVFSVLAMSLVALMIVIPSTLPPSSQEWLKTHAPSWLPVKTIVLGLDLQGGLHVLMEVNEADVTKTLVANLRDDVRRTLREEKIPISGGVAPLARGVQVKLANKDDSSRAMTKLRSLSHASADALGGVTGEPAVAISVSPEGFIQAQVTDKGVTDKMRRAVDQSIEVLRRRIDALGTTEPNIQRQGVNRILIQVPGLQKQEEIEGILNTTAKLEFRLVAEPGADPNEVEMLEHTDKGVGEKQITVEKLVMVQGEDLTDAQPGFDQRTNEPVVNFRFNLRGGQKFGEVTTKNVGRPFAIILDGKVISAPRINTPITGGAGQISGNFTVEDANRLSILLRAGALPAKLDMKETRMVGPGLGQDSIAAGKKAAYVGAGLVVAYMFLTYGIFGLFANIALFIHIVLIFGSAILLGATLTLPGIAGIVFTIGMAVDSNVLIYERIREENHAGRSILNSLDAGFNRAFATIVDSNVTMFVAAAILYFLGTGPVRGFAVSLGLGIITTIVTAVTMTRMMIGAWYHYARPTKLPI